MGTSLFKLPFFRMAIALILGIYFASLISVSLSWVESLFIVLLCLSFLVEYIPASLRMRLHLAIGLPLLLTIFLLGMLVYTFQKEQRPSLQSLFHQRVELPLLVKDLQPKKKMEQLKVQLFDTIQNRPLLSYLLLYIKPKELALRRWHYGDLIYVNLRLLPIQNFDTTGRFDYEAYCYRNYIAGQAFVSIDQVQLIDSAKLSIMGIAKQTNFWIMQRLQNYFSLDSNALGLSQALLVGDGSSMNPMINASFIHLGVIHVIVVSGMHLVLIYGIIHRLLSLFFPNKWSFYQILMELCTLWFFTLLVGAGASIVRAAVMFTILLLGKMSARRYNSTNALCAAAFFLLCYDCNWLWNVGFQLSFTAVLGILLLYKPIYSCLSFQNRALEYVWQMVSVSLAAQVLTLPLLLFHFHQFPTLFLIANVFIIPFSDILLILSMVVAFTPFGNAFFAQVFQWILSFILKVVAQLDSVPFNLIEFQYFNIFQCVLLYALIMAIIYLIQMKQKRIGLL